MPSSCCSRCCPDRAATAAVTLGAILGAFQGATATGETAAILSEAGSKTAAGAVGLALAGLLIGGWQARSANAAQRRPPRLTTAIDRAMLRTSGQGRAFTRTLMRWLGGLVALYLLSYVLVWVTVKTWDAAAGPAPQWQSRSGTTDLWWLAPLAMAALIAASLHWGKQTATLRETGSPTSTLRAEFGAATLRLALFALTGAFVIGVVAIGGLGYELVIYNTFTVAFLVLAFGLLTGPRLWLGHLAAVVVLAIHARTPLRLMTFLEDARRLGLLRTAGPVYQFRHSDLQDHLAAPYRESLAVYQTDTETQPHPAPTRRSRWSQIRGYFIVVVGAGAYGAGIGSLRNRGGAAAVLAVVLTVDRTARASETAAALHEAVEPAAPRSFDLTAGRRRRRTGRRAGAVGPCKTTAYRLIEETHLMADVMTAVGAKGLRSGYLHWPCAHGL